MQRAKPPRVTRSHLRRPVLKHLDPTEVDPEVLDWAEASGIENLKLRLATADTIAKEAATTLTVLMAGLGGSLAYGIKVFSSAPDAIDYGAALLCGYLVLLAVLLIRYCLLLSPIPALYNEPKNLAKPGYSLNRLRKVELENIQVRIQRTVARNNRIGRQLNAIRMAAVLSPALFLVGAFIGSELAPKRKGAANIDLQCTYASSTASAPVALTCKPKI